MVKKQKDAKIIMILASGPLDIIINLRNVISII